jgi:hypothetical protein
MNPGAVDRSLMTDKATLSAGTVPKPPDMAQNTPTGTAKLPGSAYQGLAHLAGPAAALRQVLAAHALRHCRHIIEIGGAGCPITGFLTHRPMSVTVIDPKIEPFSAERLNGGACRVRHLAAKFQTQDFPILKEATGLVLLGLSLKPLGRRPALGPALLALVADCRTLVIDHAVTLDRALGQIEPLIATRKTPPVIDLVLDINDSAVQAAGYGRRRFLVFDSGDPSDFG